MKNRLSLFCAAMAATAAFASQGSAMPLEKGAVVEAAAPSATVGFEVFLPLRNQAGLDSLIQAQTTPGAAEFHRWLTPSQFAAQFGPTAASMAKVQAAVRASGLTVTDVHSRSFHVVGSVAQVSKLLQTQVNTVKSPSGSMRLMAATKVTLPSAMAAEGASVVALASLEPKRVMSVKTPNPLPLNRYGPDGPYWFDDLKQAYDYPAWKNYNTGVLSDGHGVNVAVLMADLIFPGDVDAAFQHENWTSVTHTPSPSVTTVTVDGGGVYDGYGSVEASLDVQQVLGGAPGSNVTLVSIPDLSDQSIIDGYLTIVESNSYDIVNSSFGGCELGYTPAYNGGSDYTYLLNIYHTLFQQGNAQGITFVASSGDEGGILCPNVGYFDGSAPPAWIKGVSSPADDPGVTAVGGGNLITDMTPSSTVANSHYVSENGNGDPEVPYDPYGLGVNIPGGYWGAGGGRSAIFKRPNYQFQVYTASTTWRTLPDVGMQVGGCPSGLSVLPCGPDRSAVVIAYGVGIGGGYYGVIGTSVSSPEFVGALALYEQAASRQGNVNGYLYTAGAAQTAAGGVNAPAAKQYYHRPAQGFDGGWYTSYPGLNYNYIFGNGTPDVRKLFGLTNSNPALNPRSGSNP